MKQLLQLLKIACQERDEAKDQLQNLLNKFNTANPLLPNGFDQVQLHNQGPLIIPAKAHSSVTESNSLSEAYNRNSSPVDSLFDPISSPEFSNINVDKPFVQDYNQNGGFSNGLNGSGNVQKVDQAILVMEGMIKGKTLPQKGSLLQAVVEAGPLLQTLLLAGPLPRLRLWFPPLPRSPIATGICPRWLWCVGESVLMDSNLILKLCDVPGSSDGSVCGYPLLRLGSWRLLRKQRNEVFQFEGGGGGNDNRLQTKAVDLQDKFIDVVTKLGCADN
ncbi:hypothetical protein L1987_21343 [Smallanthus sonchifolius]|uniref:Uncharacterized protein n=1 Tax=Smallanthus sonchifolius TaxID=185202 RepID=A0ACB9IX82_9ASTR|nr:hypothetical protein L1987_21343 [Smallanthus sonchifolius]